MKLNFYMKLNFIEAQRFISSYNTRYQTKKITHEIQIFFKQLNYFSIYEFLEKLIFHIEKLNFSKIIKIYDILCIYK
jgi:hypothetical protein